MSDTWLLDRRRFLQLTMSRVALLSSLHLAACDTRRADSEATGSSLTPEAWAAATSAERQARVIEGLFGSRIELVREVGEIYIEALVPTGSAEAIAELLAPMVDRIDGASGEQAALRALREAITRDFQDRNTINLQGWTLAAGELQLAAIARGGSDPRGR